MLSQDIALSNIDLNNFIKQTEQKGVNIFEVNKIKPNTSIESIFKNSGHCVLFAGNPNETGHWICALRTPDKNVYFMDSFGEHPDYYSENILKCFKNNGIKNVHINKSILQDEETSTCGRYCIVFVTMHKKNIHPDKMIQFLENGKKEYGTVDNFLINLTDEL